MTSHSESRLVPYPAGLMYGVVADVERYPEFLPWVVALRVLGREQDGARQIVTAQMLVGFKALRERYTSRIVLNPAAHTIHVEQIEGVFRTLTNDWRFTEEPGGTRVDFAIEFEFKSRILGAVAGQAFSHVLTRMSEAFIARAKSIAETHRHRPGDGT